MTNFDGQVVIVTGAASGIGLGIARAFHDAGASVVLGDMQEDALEQAQVHVAQEVVDQLRPLFDIVAIGEAESKPTLLVEAAPNTIRKSAGRIGVCLSQLPKRYGPSPEGDGRHIGPAEHL